MELGRQYAAPVLCRAQHCGACAIAEENAGRAILPIQNATEGFCSDDQCVLRRSCPDHACRHRKGIEEAGANGGDVKGDTIRDAKRGLNLGRAGWKGLVRCGGRQNDQVDVAGLHSRCVDRLEAGFNCQRSGGFAFARYVPSTHAGALNDPFVARVDSLRQFLIGDTGLGQGRTRSKQGGATRHDAGDSDGKCARKLSRSSVMRWVMFSRSNLAATWTALATPLAFALPWLLTTTPLRPRKTAPLRSEEHTSELQSLMRISYDVFCLKKKKQN